MVYTHNLRILLHKLAEKGKAFAFSYATKQDSKFFAEKQNIMLNSEGEVKKALIFFSC